jgi:hypothetical protein
MIRNWRKCASLDSRSVMGGFLVQWLRFQGAIFTRDDLLNGEDCQHGADESQSVFSAKIQVINFFRGHR